MQQQQEFRAFRRMVGRADMKDKLSAPAMPIFCGKYLGGTKHLTLEQHGALMIMLMVTWENDGEPIRDDPDLISRYLCCTRDRWIRKIRPDLAPFFDLSGGTWKAVKPINLAGQWAYVQNAIAVKRANGSKGGRPPFVKFDEISESFSDTNSEKIHQTQTAKSLINNGTEKPVGYVSLNLTESTKNLNLKEESKKEERTPLSPPTGGDGMMDSQGIQEQVAKTAEPPKPQAVPEPARPIARTLFTVEEVQHAPAKGSRKSRGKTAGPKRVASPEIETAFSTFKSVYPKRNHPHSWGEAKELFIDAMESGVSGDLLIESAEKFARIVRADGDEGSRVVADARTWLSKRRWENYEGFTPVSPKHNGNVTPLRNGLPANGQVPSELVQRAGRRIV
jgi:uncharacterized protein YdaU (DUF1376 family)